MMEYLSTSIGFVSYAVRYGLWIVFSSATKATKGTQPNIEYVEVVCFFLVKLNIDYFEVVCVFFS